MTRAILILALVAAPATAQDSLTVLLGSHHVAAQVEFEERNPGIILTWDRDPLDWSVGVYRNSYGRTTVAGFASLPLIEGEFVSVSAVAGAAHYPEDGRTFLIHAGDWVPLVGLHVQSGPLSILLMPSDGQATDAVIAAGVTIDF